MNVHHSLLRGGLLLGLVSLLLSCSRVTSSSDVEEPHTTSTATEKANDLPTFLLPRKSSLRVPSSTAVLQQYHKDTEDIDQMMNELATLSDDAKLDLMERIKMSMISLESQIEPNMEWIGPETENIRAIATVGMEYTKKVIKSVEDAAALFRSTIVSESVEDETECDEGVSSEQRRRLDSHSEFTSEQTKSKPHSHGKRHQQQQQRRARQTFESFHSAAGNHPTASHRSRKLENLQGAIRDGDFNAAFSHFYAGQHSGAKRHSKARRLAANQARRLTKNEQCTLLVDCSLGMTLYDLFVYYYSDDINAHNGEVDNDIIKFDERDLSKKYTQVREKAKAINGTYDDASCNDLLQMFHRTVEHGAISNWEGASVTEVCLAEGTTVFVEFKQMLKALVDSDFDNGYNADTEVQYKTNVNKYVKMITEEIAVESFRCAEKLYWNRPGKESDKNSFPFGGCGGVATESCSIEKYKFPSEYDVSTDKNVIKHYGRRNDAAYCDKNNNELPIITADECKVAGLAIGGLKLYDTSGSGTIYSYPSGTSDRPCGCYTDETDPPTICFNGDSLHSNCVANDGYSVICQKVEDIVIEQMKLEDEYSEYQQYNWKSQCDEAKGEKTITTAEECKDAGIDILSDTGGAFYSYPGGISSRPCGCYVDGSGDFCHNGYLDKNCVASPDTSVVCNKVDVEKLKANGGDSVRGRDKHGQMMSNDNAFITVSYADAMLKVDKCKKKLLNDADSACSEQGSKKFKCLVEKINKAFQECDHFESMQTGLELIFGKATSPGFICGTTDAIVNDGVAMPGSCCLDAPYELDGDDWGEPYDCSKPCKRAGPYLAGLTSGSCDAHGGTWCASPKSNCEVLQKCVKDQIASAKEENRPAYKEHIAAAPKIVNATNQNQCGNTRKYFGYDASFINDNQICEDLQQLKYAKHFAFLNDFFGQGSGVSPADADGGEGDLVMTKPNRDASSAPLVQKNDEMTSTICALSTAVQALDDILQAFDLSDCPCDPLCISENICGAVKQLFVTIFRGLKFLADNALAITSNLVAWKGGDPATMAAQENTVVIHENMQSTADYIVLMKKDIIESIKAEAKLIVGNMKSKRKLEEGVGLRDGALVSDDSAHACNNFQAKFQILDNSKGKSLVLHTTHNGNLVDADVSFSRLDLMNHSQVSVEHNRKQVSEGISIVGFGDDADAVNFLFMEASMTDGTKVLKELVSFV